MGKPASTRQGIQEVKQLDKAIGYVCCIGLVSAVKPLLLREGKKKRGGLSIFFILWFLIALSWKEVGK